MDWHIGSQIFANIAQGIAALGALGAAIAAFVVYLQNANLERAKWALTLYERFFEKESLKKVRGILDCNPCSKYLLAKIDNKAVLSDEERTQLISFRKVENLVDEESDEFTDYLNFFEFVAFLESNKQLKRREIEALFDYYLKCLKKHDLVIEYIERNGFEQLKELLKNWK
jgi:hypothetical protein